MPVVLGVALAGALGSLSRYGISLWAARSLGTHFAYGTLLANVLGSFLLGFLARNSMDGTAITHPLRLAITVGFLGALTTFSTFGFETVRFALGGSYKLALINFGSNLTFGLAAVVGGYALGRYLFS